MPEPRPRQGDLEAATRPHAFRPSGEFVGASRAERCDLCGLAQRGPGTHHPPELGHGCADPDCDYLKPSPSAPSDSA